MTKNTSSSPRSIIALPLPRLRPDQWAIANHPAREKVVCMGRRWGKTVLGGCLALGVAAQGGKAAWIVPEYRNGDPLWRWVAHAARAGCADKRVRVLEGRRRIEFPHGGSLGIYSADNADSIRGEWFHLAVLDEAAMIAEVAWTDAIRPTLADAGGSAVLISTPKGRNWFWRAWVRGQARMDAEAAAFTAPTADNPIATIRAEFERARETLSERSFRQEWLAEFIQDGGGVFRYVHEACTGSPAEPIRAHQYVLGVDWGRFHDFTVFCVLDATAKRQVHLDRFTGVDFEQQRGRLLALYERWRPQLVIAESNSVGRPIIERLWRDDLPVKPFEMTAAAKMRAVDDLALAFESRQLALLDDAAQRDELLAFEAEQLPGGLLRYSAPEGMHDDTVIALALAWQGAKHESDAPLVEEKKSSSPSIIERYPQLLHYDSVRARFPAEGRRWEREHGR